MYILLLALFYNINAFSLTINDEIQGFIDKMASEHKFSKKSLQQLFTETDFDQDVIDKISKPKENWHWERYKKIFLNKKRIELGKKFISKNSKSLTEAEKKWGVPTGIIAAILGVETYYGQVTGNDSVFRSLTTLAFNYPKRSKFFTSELESYLLLCKDLGRSPKQFKGSYAGAMGTPQFMPSNYKKLAVAKKGSSPDLFNNIDDVIFSVANYLSFHGWKRGKPAITLSSKAKGIEFKDGSKTYSLQQNFGVLKKYNTSDNYAMAVVQLADAITN